MMSTIRGNVRFGSEKDGQSGLRDGWPIFLLPL
jgi:hypothetical protein